MQKSPAPLDDLVQPLLAKVFRSRCLDTDLREILSWLNARTSHRFTGVYRFEPGWVVSVALFDREAPDVRIGADVKMKESYCWLTGLGGVYRIEDARSDERLAAHAAREEVRSYVAVALQDRSGQPWGTLCHFDFAPREAAGETMHELEAIRPLIEEVFIRDARAAWDPDAPSAERCLAIGANAAQMS